MLLLLPLNDFVFLVDENVLLQKLTDLVFSNMRSHCTVEDYRKFLPHFKQLQVLDVASNYSGFDDKCLEIVGIHCNLRYDILLYLLNSYYSLSHSFG